MLKNVITAIIISSLFIQSAISENSHKAPIRWSTTQPDATKADAGFEILPDTTHYTIFAGSKDLGMFNHGPMLHYSYGKLFVTWFSHAQYEGAPGTRGLYSFSEDMKTWSKPAVLLDSIGQMTDKSGVGVSIYPIFREVNGRLYTTATVHEITGWEKRGTTTGPVHRSLPRVAKYIDADGMPDKNVYWLAEEIPSGHEDKGIKPYHQAENDMLRSDLSELKRMREEREKRYYFPKHEYEGVSFCEPTYFFRPDGKEVGIYRDNGQTMRLYAALRDSIEDKWSVAIKTNIFDSPSKSVAGSLPDGTVFLIGNFLDKLWLRDPLIIATSTDGINFDKAYALRCGAAYPREKNPRDHKGPGFQYPNAIVVEDTLWVAYAISKEQIGITRIPVETLQRR